MRCAPPPVGRRGRRGRARRLLRPLEPPVAAQRARGRAPLGVALEARVEKGGEVGGKVGRQRRVVVLHDPVEGGDRLEVVVRRLAVEQLEDRAAERPDVRRRREAGHLDHLGRHPVGCADDGRRLDRGVCRGLDAARDAKVGELDLAVLRDQQVRPLDVAVAHALLVQPLQPQQHLPNVDADQVRREGAKVFDEGGERAVLDVLEDEVEVALGPDRLEVPHDLRVLQVVQQVDLRLHRLQVAGRHVARRDLLDRAKVARLAVERAEDLAGAAAAELLA